MYNRDMQLGYFLLFLLSLLLNVYLLTEQVKAVEVITAPYEWVEYDKIEAYDLRREEYTLPECDCHELD